MTKADEYRLRLISAREKAIVAIDAEFRGQLQRIAEHWRELAQMAERRMREKA